MLLGFVGKQVGGDGGASSGASIAGFMPNGGQAL